MLDRALIDNGLPLRDADLIEVHPPADRRLVDLRSELLTGDRERAGRYGLGPTDSHSRGLRGDLRVDRCALDCHMRILCREAVDDGHRLGDDSVDVDIRART